MPISQSLLAETKAGIKFQDISAILAGSVAMILASWLRAAIAGTIMVDEHALTGLPAYSVYFLFCGGLTLYSVAYFGLWRKNRFSLQQTRVLAYSLVALFSLMLPLLSNDVFSLLAYGDLVNHGVDVFSQSHISNSSAYYAYCNPQFAGGPNVYGPLFTGMLQLATYFFPHSVFGALALYKLFALGWAVLFIEMAFRTAKFIKASSQAFLFIVLNPVFLLQGLGQLHSDLIAAAICICIVYAVLRHKFNLALVFAALAIAVKLNYVLIIPYLVIVIYIGSKNKHSFFSKILIGASVVAATLFAIYFPYFTGKNTVMVPFWTVYNQIPSKSIPEVFGDIIYYINLYFTGHLSAGNTMTGDAAVAAQKLIIWTNLITICRLVALVTSSILFFHFFKTAKDSRKWMKTYLRLLLLFLLFYSHVIYAWYLIMILPFVWYERDKGFMTWLLVLTCFSNAQTIMCAVDRSSSLYWTVLPLIALNVFIFIWRFRPNFLHQVELELVEKD